MRNVSNYVVIEVNITFKEAMFDGNFCKHKTDGFNGWISQQTKNEWGNRMLFQFKVKFPKHQDVSVLSLYFCS